MLKCISKRRSTSSTYSRIPFSLESSQRETLTWLCKSFKCQILQMVLRPLISYNAENLLATRILSGFALHHKSTLGVIIIRGWAFLRCKEADRIYHPVDGSWWSDDNPWFTQLLPFFDVERMKEELINFITASKIYLKREFEHTDFCMWRTMLCFDLWR